MSEWSFANLDLTGTVAQRASQGLPPGKHVCVIVNAEIKPSRSGFMVVLYMDELEGLGSCRDYITLHSNSDSEGHKLAEKIGKERFKAVLVCAEHPTPDNPKNIESICGLVVGVIVEQSEDWVDPEGELRRGGTKPRRNGAYVPAKTLGYTGPLRISTAGRTVPTGTSRPRKATADAFAAAAEDLDDSIPF